MTHCRCPYHEASPNPRNQGFCKACGLRLPPEPTRARCRHCDGPVDLHTAYVIGFHKLAPMEWIYLCDECSADLRVWLRQVPL